MLFEFVVVELHSKDSIVITMNAEFKKMNLDGIENIPVKLGSPLTRQSQNLTTTYHIYLSIS